MRLQRQALPQSSLGLRKTADRVFVQPLTKDSFCCRMVSNLGRSICGFGFRVCRTNFMLSSTTLVDFIATDCLK